MSEYALEVEGLVKEFHRRDQPPLRAVDGLSFRVRRGCIFGLLGPNGAGKTTTLKILTTLVRPTAGRAAVMGYDVLHQPLAVRRRIAVVLQETAVDLFLSVRDNLLSYVRFHGLDRYEARRRTARALEQFHLLDAAGSKVMDLSGGLRRRVQVAKVFLVDTPVVFLDEFSTGMDPILKREVMDRLRQEAARGRTIVLTTQILSEAEELCDDILILHRGRPVARGDLNTLKLLSKDVYELSLTFDALPAGLREELEQLAPVRLTIHNNSVEIALRAEESRVLELASALARRAQLLHLEVRGASLEDIFLELTRPTAGTVPEVPSV
ncbi:MAG: ABC transporter ATP-binding protein [Acidobacteriia bacterium]|jgi:ABC-type multidrug transport system ATPase subunit|nr:ABC transporter ATP-binding protein [Terriglobia bacterium]